MLCLNIIRIGDMVVKLIKYDEVILGKYEFEDRQIKIQYYLTKDKCNIEGIEEAVYMYGVEVVKKMNSSGVLMYEESQKASQISRHKSEVEGIIRMLSKNTVTPMSLYYVLDNLIGIKC